MSALSNRLARVEAQTSSGAALSDRPTAVEICLAQLEEIVLRNMGRVGGRHWVNAEYDHFHIYAHRLCLASKGDVKAAPDRVLLEALRLDGESVWGWLQFIIREINFIVVLAANWGLPTIQGDYGGADGVPLTTSPQRWAQAAVYFCELMRERGRDVLAEVQASARTRMDERGMSEAEFADYLRGHNEWAYILYTCADVLKPELVSGYTEIRYAGDSGASFLAGIREAAARRREAWDTPHPSLGECMAAELGHEKAAELRAVAAAVQEPNYQRLVVGRQPTPDSRLLDELMRVYGDGRCSTTKWESNEGHLQPLELMVFVLVNPKVLDLLRLPENREMGLTIKKYIPWVYVPFS